MNILLIGNGFDLAHELPTKYTHFPKFLKATQDIFDPLKRICGELTDISKLGLHPTLEKYLLTMASSTDNPLLNELIEISHKNLWVNYFMPSIGSALGKETWIDFESLISNIIQSLDRFNGSLSKEERFQIIGQLGPMRKILESENLLYGATDSFRNERLLTDLDRLIRGLEIYLCLCLDLINPTHRLQAVTDIGAVDGVLSFNYTNTLERIYQPGQFPMPEYCYIHGRAQSKDSQESNNMVLGIDEYLDATERNRQFDFIRFKKYYQRIFKQTDYNYTKWFHNMELKNLYIIGHSLDETDKDVLQDVLTSEGVKTTIFYHNKQANATQIENLVKVLGYDTLNAYTRGGGLENSIVFSQLY